MVDYGEVSTPWFRLIVIHCDLTVNVVFLQLLWAYNTVVFTHLTFYPTGMTLLGWLCPIASGCDSDRMVKKSNLSLHRNDFIIGKACKTAFKLWYRLRYCSSSVIGICG